MGALVLQAVTTSSSDSDEGLRKEGCAIERRAELIGRDVLAARHLRMWITCAERRADAIRWLAWLCPDRGAHFLQDAPRAVTSTTDPW